MFVPTTVCGMNKVRDKLNPLHVYCRLRDAGIEGGRARSVATDYEHYFYRGFDRYLLAPLHKFEYYIRGNGRL